MCMRFPFPVLVEAPMSSYSGPVGSEDGGGPRFRLEGFPEEEEHAEGIPIARSVDNILLFSPSTGTAARRAMEMAESGTPSPHAARRPYLFAMPRNASQNSLHSTHGYGIHGGATEGRPAVSQQQQFHRDHNMAIRYRLFNRLDPGGRQLVMPSHVIPDTIFSILPFDDFTDREGKQSSLVTIFSIWNTMMGTSLLCVPWALQQAGLVLGLCLFLFMAALAFYTAYRVIESPRSLAIDSANVDVSDVARYFWGKWGEYFAVFFSITTLAGGVILYYVLMSNFLFYTGNIVYEAMQPNSSIIPIMVNKSLTCDVFCPLPLQKSGFVELGRLGAHLLKWAGAAEKEGSLGRERLGSFEQIWTLQGGVPLILFVCLFPLLNFRSPNFFMRFNVLGTVSVAYLICFTIAKSAECRINVDFFDPDSEHFVKLFNPNFPALTGTLALSYFIHNAILTILRNQKHPENNARDLFIGYALSALCYILISVLFFLSFPTYKSCISDNFLNNFGSGDVLSAVARIFLLFQMVTVLPLLMYLIRVQFSYVFAGTVYPGLFYVILINAAILTVAAFFAVVYPHVGSIIRYVGSLSGLVYMFLLPCLIHLKRLQMQGRLTRGQIVVHCLIMLCGVLNLFAQFLV